ncbi:MAG: hypothetical protein Q4D85_08300 [Corynebacterium sp.]|uniref:hypothetical protein n=1 Tax=Corynebacterium sp. TaxID=1720 RepID=UPI0026DA79C9|nr:hypothetical protein [Corynebacterium sp.]MDO5098747.1 hypothetical protein [Corynebacterium sp.]
MINHEDFFGFDGSDFELGGLSPELLAEGFAFAPDWLPQDFKDFFLDYYSWTVNGTEILPPAPAVVWDNAQEENFNDFREWYPGREDFYPIAKLNGASYLVFHRKSDGQVECGYYDFTDEAWWGGPYESFEKWAYALLENQRD